MRLELLGAAIAALITSTSAYGAATVYKFSGEIRDIRDFGSGVTSTFGYGSRFFGYLSYDPSEPYSYQIEPGRHLFDGPLAPFAANVDGIEVAGNSAQVQLFDNYSGPNPYDMVFISSSFSELPIRLQAGTSVATLRLQLRDGTGTVVQGMQLPKKLALEDYDTQRHFGLTGYTSSGGFAWHLAGNIDSLTAVSASAVPEPTTWAMMIGGFGMVGGALRSARRKQKVSVSYA